VSVAIVEPAELPRARAELDRLDRKIADAELAGDADRALRLRRDRFSYTFTLWARPELNVLMAFSAALMGAAQGLDAETLDHLADELRPAGIGRPGARGG
jgi:hypothetical protein